MFLVMSLLTQNLKEVNCRSADFPPVNTIIIAVLLLCNNNTEETTTRARLTCYKVDFVFEAKWEKWQHKGVKKIDQ